MQQDLKKLVMGEKENRNISIYKVNMDEGKSSSRLPGTAFRKLTSRKEFKQSRARK